MKTFMILMFIALASAKPQAYHYQPAQVPFNPVQAPSAHVGQLAPAAQQLTQQLPPVFSTAPQVGRATFTPAQATAPAAAPQPSTQYLPAYAPAPVPAAPAHSHPQFAAPAAAPQPSTQYLPAYAPAPVPAAPAHSHPQFVAPAPQLSHHSQAPAYLPPFQPVQTFVSKHFYLHAAPEEDLQHDDSFQPGPVRKHYRVVFIKSPTSGNLAGLLQAAKPKDEEKTVIYVLNKKTDVADLKHVLDTQNHHPTKPEVFFIKYKTPEEALHAQHEIQAQYDALGGTSEVSDEGLAPVQSFIGSVPQAPNNQYLPSAH